MAQVQHRDVALGQRHGAHNWEYSDAAARTGATGLASTDVNKLALQLDDGSFWRLTNHSPVTWAAVGGGGGVTDHGALTGLADDDHSQYHNDARGDARYSQLGHTHSTADITGLTEAVQDIVGAMIVAGADMGTITYDDTAGTVTINGVAGLTTEQVQDIVGAMVVAGANVTATYDDTAGTLTIASTAGGGGTIAVQEQDGSPNVAAVNTIKVPNGTLTDNTGGVVSLDYAKSTHVHSGADITSGTVDGARLPAASTSAAGIVELATSAETTAGLAVQASDTRLSDSRTPTAHTHPEGDLALTDITTNNASTTKHGFLKKLSNVATEYMDGTGNWSTPAGGMTNPMTTANDIIIGGTSGTPARLAKGANGTYLGVDGSGNLAYSTPAGGGGATTSTVRVPINLTNPRSTSLAGNAFWTVAGLTAWDAGHWEFLKDVEGRIYGTVAIPHNVAGTPNAKLVLVLGANATSGVTRLTVGTKAVADAASLDPASFTAETAIDTTVPGTARLRKDVTFPASGALSETVTADDILIVELTHNGDHTNDTLAVNTELYAAWLQIDVTG